jgi:hypothetical protein
LGQEQGTAVNIIAVVRGGNGEEIESGWLDEADYIGIIPDYDINHNVPTVESVKEQWKKFRKFFIYVSRLWKKDVIIMDAQYCGVWNTRYCSRDN